MNTKYKLNLYEIYFNEMIHKYDTFRTRKHWFNAVFYG